MRHSHSAVILSLSSPNSSSHAQLNNLLITRAPLSYLQFEKEHGNLVCRTALCAFEIVNAAQVQNMASAFSYHDPTVEPAQSNPRGGV